MLFPVQNPGTDLGFPPWCPVGPFPYEVLCHRADFSPRESWVSFFTGESCHLSCIVIGLGGPSRKPLKCLTMLQKYSKEKFHMLQLSHFLIFAKNET